jgi:hypothetical protein
MKVGDLIRLKNTLSTWGPTALVIEIRVTPAGTGLVDIMTAVSHNCTIPWTNRDMYIAEVLSESR